MVLLAAEFHDFLARFPQLRTEMERCKAEQRSTYAGREKRALRIGMGGGDGTFRRWSRASRRDRVSPSTNDG